MKFWLAPVPAAARREFDCGIADAEEGDWLPPHAVKANEAAINAAPLAARADLGKRDIV